MADFYIGFILEGRTTYADAVYLFYYKFPTVAEKVVKELQLMLISEDREDLLVEPEVEEAIIEQAKADRKKYIDKNKATATVTK